MSMAEEGGKKEGRRPPVVEGGETGGEEGGEKRFVNYDGRTVYLGEQRVLSYDEEGKPVYCKVVGFNLSGDAPLVNVVFADSGRKGGKVEEEWTFGRFADLELVEETPRASSGEQGKEGLPRMTSQECRLFYTMDGARLDAMKGVFKKRLGVEEGDKTRKVLLDGKEVEMVVTEDDFGTIVRQ